MDLVAEPMDGFYFNGWQGGPGGSALETSFVLNGDTNVEALFSLNFSPPYASLRTDAVPAAGGVLTGQGAWVGYGQNTVVSAVANPGYEFVGWTGFEFSSASPSTVYPVGLGSSYLVAKFRPIAVISKAGETMQLTWPNNATGWAMQTTTTLATGSWGPLPWAAQQSGDFQTVPLPQSAQRAFFRLVGP